MQIQAPLHQATHTLATAEFKPYCRLFKQPIFFAQGLWQRRVGWLLKLQTQDGECGYGEIASLPPLWGGESLDDLRQVIHSFPSTALNIESSIRKCYAFPALQSGLGMALMDLQGYFKKGLEKTLSISGFLPHSDDSIQALHAQYAQGYRTFKLKIGLSGMHKEQAFLDQLWAEWPQEAKLRLDANQSLSEKKTHQWLEYLQGKPVEFLEEPYFPEDFDDLIELAQASPISIALDEQVGTIHQLKHVCQAGWPGLCVIKPSALGNWPDFIEFRKKSTLQRVYSTAFETAIGAYALAFLAAEENQPIAAGLGALSSIADDGLGFTVNPILKAGLQQPDLESLWNLL